MLIRPTMKFIRLGYGAVFSVLAVATGLWANVYHDAVWLPVAGLLLLLWPAARHARRSFTKVTITGDKLRYETGFLSKTTRTIQLSKVQDVRVDQSLGQRLFGVGNLSIETAGETSRLTVADIDDPQETADQIVEASQHGVGKGHKA